MADRTAPTDNPSGPFGQVAQDRREWDAMKAKQDAIRKPIVQQGTPTTGSDYQGNNGSDK